MYICICSTYLIYMYILWTEVFAICIIQPQWSKNESISTVAWGLKYLDTSSNTQLQFSDAALPWCNTPAGRQGELSVHISPCSSMASLFRSFFFVFFSPSWDTDRYSQTPGAGDETVWPYKRDWSQRQGSHLKVKHWVDCVGGHVLDVDLCPGE